MAMENGVTSREEPTSPKTSSAISETISRLSAKPGVTATLVIDRSTNTILQSNGNFAALSTSEAVRRPSATTAAGASSSTGGSGEHKTNLSAEDGIDRFASMIWNYVNSTAGLVQSLDTEDDLKLLRLRTKKYELVIVPDPKFIFVVAHEVPSA